MTGDYDRGLTDYIDRFCDLVVTDMGGFERCAEFFTTRHTDTLWDFGETQYKKGATLRQAVLRYFCKTPDARYFKIHGELPGADVVLKEIKLSDEKTTVKPIEPVPELPYETARRQRRALWKLSRFSAQSLEVTT